MFSIPIIFLIATASFAQSKFAYGTSISIDHDSYLLVSHDGAVTFHGQIGFSAGFIARRKIADRAFLKTGFFLSQKSYIHRADPRKFNSNSVTSDPGIINGSIDSKVSSPFITVPVDLQFHLHPEKKITVYPLVGLVHSFRFGKDSRYYTAADYDFFQLIGYNKYFLGVKTGVGFQLNLEKIGFSVEPQMRVYLNKVHDWFPEKNPIFIGMEFSVLKF